MKFETDNQEIIELYKLYIEVINFINHFDELKNKFINHFNIKTSSNYYAFPNDKFGYSAEQKVCKEFIKGLDISNVNKYINLYCDLKGKYMMSVNNNIYLRQIIINYENGYKKDLLKSSINLDKALSYIKNILKSILIKKLNNKEIEYYI